MKCFFVIMPAIFFAACSYHTEKQTITILDSTNISDSIDEDNSGTGCVFDTSTYKFTTEKLRGFKKDILFTWDDHLKAATVLFYNSDTLKLHIGGCSHFSFSILYTTDAAKFNDDPYLIDKARWLAATFLDDGFDKEYSDALVNKQFTKESPRNNFKSVTIINSDTSSVSNRIHEPILFELANNRTIISIGCFVN
jgi:hypothetical protein